MWNPPSLLASNPPSLPARDLTPAAPAARREARP